MSVGEVRGIQNYSMFSGALTAPPSLPSSFSPGRRRWPNSNFWTSFGKIQQAIGPHEDLLTIVKRRKLQWYSHVSRSSGLAKTILQGTVKGGQGGQKKRWEDNIRE